MAPQRQHLIGTYQDRVFREPLQTRIYLALPDLPSKAVEKFLMALERFSMALERLEIAVEKL